MWDKGKMLEEKNLKKAIKGTCPITLCGGVNDSILLIRNNAYIVLAELMKRAC